MIDADRGTVIATDVSFALERRERSRGLLVRDSMARGEALVFPRCRQVHTFGMRFAIDVLFLDKDNVAVRAYRGLAPGRLTAWVRRARMVVELPSGALEAASLEVGDTVTFEQ